MMFAIIQLETSNKWQCFLLAGNSPAHFSFIGGARVAQLIATQSLFSHSFYASSHSLIREKKSNSNFMHKNEKTFYFLSSAALFYHHRAARA
jgi:hypothetical protein